MTERIEISEEISIEIVDQVIYDAYMMPLSTFVTYYRTINKIPLQSKGGGSSGMILREWWQTIRNRLTEGSLTVDKKLKESSLRKWVDEQRLNWSDLTSIDEGTFNQPKIIKTKVVKKTPLVYDDDEFDFDILSRKEQVRYLMEKEGFTSCSLMAKEMDTNPSYVQRLKKEIENE